MRIIFERYLRSKRVYVAAMRRVVPVLDYWRGNWVEVVRLAAAPHIDENWPCEHWS